jgi:hypothetical protein
MTMLHERTDVGSALPTEERTGPGDRAEPCVGRFVGRPQSDRWGWDARLFSMIGYPSASARAPLNLLLRHVSEDDRQVLADAFRAATEQWRSFVVPCRLRSTAGSMRPVLIAAELMEAEPSGFAIADLVLLDGLAAGSGPWLSGHVIDLTDLTVRDAVPAAGSAPPQP